MRGSGQQLGPLLNAVSRALGGDDPLRMRNLRVAALWDQVAGEVVASHTADAHLRRGEYVVYVDSPAWANDLAAMSEMYREALNEAMGKEVVTSVRFEVNRGPFKKRVSLAREKERENVVEPDPVALTSEERAQLERSVAAIDDETLRNAVLRAAIADLERQKGIRSSKTP